MGCYSARRPGFLQAWQINAAYYVFEGLSDTQICEKLWGTDPTDKRALNNAKGRLRRLMRDEKFQEYYRTIIQEWSVHHTGKALNTIAKQMDDPNPWMANKAANDVLTHSKTIITGADDDTVVVKFEGMPVLGSPAASGSEDEK